MTGLTIAQGRALIRIIEGWDNGNHVTRPDIPTKTRAALFDAGYITIGTMVYPDALHPTDDGRAAAAKVVGRLNRDPNSVHEPGSYEWARAREAEALDAYGHALVEMPATNRAALESIAWPVHVHQEALS